MLADFTLFLRLLNWTSLPPPTTIENPWLYLFGVRDILEMSLERPEETRNVFKASLGGLRQMECKITTPL